MEHKFCEMYVKHPAHEWSSGKNHFWCHGKVTHMRPGDAPRSLRDYFCKRQACGRKILVMAFRGPDEYCCVNCEKLDKGEDTKVHESATPG